MKAYEILTCLICLIPVVPIAYLLLTTPNEPRDIAYTGQQAHSWFCDDRRYREITPDGYKRVSDEEIQSGCKHIIIPPMTQAEIERIIDSQEANKD